VSWFHVDAGAMDAPVAFGRMPMLAAAVVSAGTPMLMTGMFGRGHFQIGWFEDVDAVLDLEAARERGVDVFRRPIWGGGTAFYDTDAVSLLSFFLPDDAFATLDEALDAHRPVMRGALDAVGLGEAAFEGSSDIRWRGRKLGTLISQSVLGTKVVGGFFNLRPPDLATYAAVAHPPEEKFADKDVSDPLAYLCAPAELRGSDLPYEELRDAIVREAKAAGMDLVARGFTPEEEAGVEGFVATVSADDWVRRVSSERFRGAAPPGTRVGFANHKGKKLVRAGVAVDAGGTIARAMMAGDMHLSPPDVMDRMAAALEGGQAADRDDVRARAAAVLGAGDVSQPDETAGITADDCAIAVVRAAERAA